MLGLPEQDAQGVLGVSSPLSCRAHCRRLFDLIGNSVGVATGHKQEGALVRGKAKIPTNLLDASGFIPLLLCLASYVYSFLRGQFSIGLWNKTFIAASCMAIMKGFTVARRRRSLCRGVAPGRSPWCDQVGRASVQCRAGCAPIPWPRCVCIRMILHCLWLVPAARQC